VKAILKHIESNAANAAALDMPARYQRSLLPQAQTPVRRRA
jgi:hypothetical protein